MFIEQEILYFENFDLTSVVTPVHIDNYRQLLLETSYNVEESEFLVNGFKNGFDIGYQGRKKNIQRTAPNLKLRVGSEVELWNKIMKEVKLKRYAGPFKDPPFKDYIQSPVGLVPKDNGKETRLIFHLSYPKGGSSINSETPSDLCSVQYCDFSDAVRRCLEEGQFCYVGKSDMKSAFRNLGLLVENFPWLLLKARSPIDGRIYWFVEKCLPFGASISCSHFQRFSDSVAHIVKVKNHGKTTVNYLDDYLFADFLKRLCDAQIQRFLDICSEIGFPVSLEKTFWGTQLLAFLGLLLDTARQIVCIPEAKVTRALELIDEMLAGKKTTVYKIQRLAGFLNFLCRSIVPGRAFTRRMYSYYTPTMKPHHHLNIRKEIRDDLEVWKNFLSDAGKVYCRPFMDFLRILKADEMDWYTDASGGIGFGGHLEHRWFQEKWSADFLRNKKPSIQFLELYAVTVSVLLWGHLYTNKRIKLYCDNENVVRILDENSSGCKNCMVLVRILVKACLSWNLRIFGQHVRTKDNYLADALSRFQMKRFWRDVQKDGRTMNNYGEEIPHVIWPVEKIWVD